MTHVVHHRDPVDEAALEALDLFIMNTSELYPQRRAIQENMSRRIENGSYDPLKAPKLFLYLIDNGAKAYSREFGAASDHVFSPATREALAQRMAHREYAELMLQQRPARPTVRGYGRGRGYGDPGVREGLYEPAGRGSREPAERSSWHIDLDEEHGGGRWVQAQLRGTWMSAYLQAPGDGGYWVQFDADSPYRWVPEIRDSTSRGSESRPWPRPSAREDAGPHGALDWKQRGGAWVAKTFGGAEYKLVPTDDGVQAYYVHNGHEHDLGKHESLGAAMGAARRHTPGRMAAECPPGAMESGAGDALDWKQVGDRWEAKAPLGGGKYIVNPDPNPGGGFEVWYLPPSKDEEAPLLGRPRVLGAAMRLAADHADRMGGRPSVAAEGAGERVPVLHEEAAPTTGTRTRPSANTQYHVTPEDHAVHVTADGKVRPVKNLGWLLRNWQAVDHFEVVGSPFGKFPQWDALMVAKLKDGGQYEALWADRGAMRDWLHRPVFRGIRVDWSGKSGVAEEYGVGEDFKTIETAESHAYGEGFRYIAPKSKRQYFIYKRRPVGEKGYEQRVIYFRRGKWHVSGDKKRVSRLRSDALRIKDDAPAAAPEQAPMATPLAPVVDAAAAILPAVPTAQEADLYEAYEAKLTAAKRRALPPSAFALPERRALPIEDKKHVKAAAGRLSMMLHQGSVSRAEFDRAHRRIARAGRRYGIEIGAAEDCVGIHTHAPVDVPATLASVGSEESGREWQTFYIVDTRIGKAVAGPFHPVDSADAAMRNYSPKTHQVIGSKYLNDLAFQGEGAKVRRADEEAATHAPKTGMAAYIEWSKNRESWVGKVNKRHAFTIDPSVDGWVVWNVNRQGFTTSMVKSPDTETGAFPDLGSAKNAAARLQHVSREGAEESRPAQGHRWDVPLDEKIGGRWVEAQMPRTGEWMSAYLQAPGDHGGYWVQFDPDAPFRWVPEIRETNGRKPPPGPGPTGTLRGHGAAEEAGECAPCAAGEAQEAAEEKSKKSKKGKESPAKEDPSVPMEGHCATIVSNGDHAVIERTAACRPTGISIDNAADVWKLMYEQCVKRGSEWFFVIGVTTQGEMLGSPVEVAKGQPDRVSVDVEQIVAAAIHLAAGGARGVVIGHQHPSGGHSRPSTADRRLTEDVRKSMAIACPSTAMIDHVIVSPTRDGHGEYFSFVAEEEDKKSGKRNPGITSV